MPPQNNGSWRGTQTPPQSASPRSGAQSSAGSSTHSNPSAHGNPSTPPHFNCSGQGGTSIVPLPASQRELGQLAERSGQMVQTAGSAGQSASVSHSPVASGL